jgi:hypothetical protein
MDCQRNDPFAMNDCQRAGRGNKAAIRPNRKCFDNALDFVDAMHVDWHQLHPK